MAVDISGWRLKDETFVTSHIFPDNTIIPDQCAVVVFGAGSLTGEFGGSLVQIATFGALRLANGGDWVSVNNSENELVLRYEYGPEAGDDQSITRDPDISGPAPLVLHTTATGSGGRCHSPGTKVDGSLFSGCQ